jgi:hypothetical protein
VVVWDETIGRRTGAKAVPKGWWAGAGSLTATFVFPAQPERSPDEKIGHTADAVIRVAASFQPTVPLTFRAPNDLFLADRKAGAVWIAQHAGLELITVRLNCSVDLAKAPVGIAENAARLVDYIDVNQLPLQQAGTLTNTCLNRLMSALPKLLSAPAS